MITYMPLRSTVGLPAGPRNLFVGQDGARTGKLAGK